MKRPSRSLASVRKRRVQVGNPMFRMTTNPAPRHSDGMSFMGRIEKRWDARQTGLEPFTFEVSIEISSPAKALWSFILHAKSAQLVDPRVVNAFRVPETPAGELGEQQCMVIDDGGVLTAHIGEIVSIEAPRLVAVRWLTVPGRYITTHLIEGLGLRSRLTYHVQGQTATGTGKATQEQLRSHAAASLARVRAVVESGARFPSDT